MERELLVCGMCSALFERPSPKGRKPEYCGAACRQAAWRQRQAWSSEGRCCANCRFSDPALGDDDSLFVRCRRYPPQLIVLANEPLLVWPQVRSEDWCGEYARTVVSRGLVQ